MSTPPPTVAQAHRDAANLHDTLNTLLHLTTNIGVDPDGTPYIDIQIPVDTATAVERRALAVAAAHLITPAHPDTMLHATVYAPDVTTWGSVGARGTWAGHPTRVWTALTRAEARALHLATCTACGHGDHDTDQTCLAAMVTDEGDERACECGLVLDPPKTYVHDWAQQDRDDEAWEARRDAALDAWQEANQ